MRGGFQVCLISAFMSHLSCCEEFLHTDWQTRDLLRRNKMESKIAHKCVFVRVSQTRMRLCCVYAHLKST